jgi:D-3-phosphoglycerate dehydrogenase
MTWVIVVADRVAEAGLALLRAAPDVDLRVVAGNREGLRQALPEANALVVRSDTKVTDELMALAPHLRVIGRAGIGVDNIDLAAATRRGIPVLNAPGANTVSAAEHAVALLLALVRRVPQAAHSMSEGRWDRSAFAGVELRGKTLGVIGLGRVGAHVAGIARAIGMKVIAHDPFLPATRAKDLGVALLPLDDVLSQADVVTLHLPLTKETRGMIGKERLARMKPGALLINAARGELVDEAALIAALSDHRLGGAGLDVFAQEPLPADAPLRKLEPVVLTPHVAASTREAQDRAAVEIGQAVLAALVTGDVANAVNVSGVSADAMRRSRPVFELARRLGHLGTCLATGAVEAVEVEYGGDDEAAPWLAELAAVEGLLSAMGVGPVSIVNALPLAEERHIRVSRRAGDPLLGYHTTVRVTLRNGAGAATVAGALAGERGRIVRIDEFAVDVPAEGHLIVLRNRDVPGVIGRVGTILGAAGANIGAYHQSRRAGQPEAIAAIVLDLQPDAEIVRQLCELPDVLDVRVAALEPWPVADSE